MSRPFTVTAILAAFNEEDIVAQSVAHLIAQGVQVYFIDHGSTDGTVEAVQPFLGKGLVHIERNPTLGMDDQHEYSWKAVLRRKEALARELDSDWFIHHDADEFRESPWRDLNVRQAIQQVDGFGYSAIDFELLNFWPTHDAFTRGDDVSSAMPFYAAAGAFDKLQVKCWKNGGVPVDLVSSGGHDALFEGRRVFPIRFLLRHYPIRSRAHAARKILAERLNRFSRAERAAGWHVQYDDILAQSVIIRDPTTLERYDADRVRLQLVLQHREMEAAEAARQAAEAAVARLQDDVARLQGEVALRQGEIARLQGELDGILSSRSWRLTVPLRLLRRISGRKGSGG